MMILCSFLCELTADTSPFDTVSPWRTLGRRLSAAQWGSLFILMAGVAFIQMPESKGGDDVDASMGGRLLGLAMVITACFSSGFAGIYFEKMLKGETAGVWVLNVQLGFLGMIVGTIGLLYRSYDDGEGRRHTADVL